MILSIILASRQRERNVQVKKKTISRGGFPFLSLSLSLPSLSFFSSQFPRICKCSRLNEQRQQQKKKREEGKKRLLHC